MIVQTIRLMMVIVDTQHCMTLLTPCRSANNKFTNNDIN